MNKYFICVILLALPYTSNARLSGQDLLSNCSGDKQTDPDAVIKSMHCAGYMNGILDGAELIFGLKPESRLFCPPDIGVSTKEQLLIVIKYLMEHPKTLDNSARISVLNAFVETYPCK